MSISNRFVRLGALVAVFLVAQVMWVHAVFAETITVTTINDELDSASDCTDNPEDCSLREAIAAVNLVTEGDYIISIPADTELEEGHITISIENASGEENSNATGDFDIDFDGNSLLISGAGMEETTIDGNNQDRIFDIDNSTGHVAFSSLTVVDGNTTSLGSGFSKGGAGMRINDDNDFPIEIDAVLFNSNQSGYVGGAIYFSGAQAIINNSYFTGNDGSTRGGRSDYGY